ncbi:MAG: DUF4386 domain-containing protein [Gemmatimonadales bacterium]
MKSSARFAGLLYLLSALPNVFSYIYLPKAMIVPGDAAATARRITDALPTYRMGILCDLLGQVLFIWVVLSLYNLLKDVDKRYARLMVTLVAVGVAVQIANVFNLMAPLILLSGADFLSPFTKPQLDALVLGFLTLRGDAIFVSQVFWGLWLFPFGVLVIRSGFFPKFLGVLLIVACVAYVNDSFANLVMPAWAHIADQLVQVFGSLGEVSMLLWLIIMGAKEPPKESPALP